MLAGAFALPTGCYRAGRSEIALAFILVMIVFMSLFLVPAILIQRGISADVQAVIEAFGKNEYVMRVCRALVVTIAGLVITKVLDPGKAQQEGSADDGSSIKVDV